MEISATATANDDVIVRKTARSTVQVEKTKPASPKTSVKIGLLERLRTVRSWLFFLIGGIFLILMAVMVYWNAHSLFPSLMDEELLPPEDVPMILVPAGPFEMGSEDGNIREKPVHTVRLDDFYIDQYEVTNAHYAVCVVEGVCDPPLDNSSSTRRSYYGNAKFADYPVIYVTWDAARSYCEWRGARLPTEAEWEKAARGGIKGANYPWGNTFVGTIANYCDINCENDWRDQNFDDGYADTAPIGTYPPNGFEQYDMAGNVEEWTADWYDFEYYSNSPESSPTGPDNGVRRVSRGGSRIHSGSDLRVYIRGHHDPFGTYNAIGFRCVRDASP